MMMVIGLPTGRLDLLITIGFHSCIHSVLNSSLAYDAYAIGIATIYIFMLYCSVINLHMCCISINSSLCGTHQSIKISIYIICDYDVMAIGFFLSRFVIWIEFILTLFIL